MISYTVSCSFVVRWWLYGEKSLHKLSATGESMRQKLNVL